MQRIKLMILVTLLSLLTVTHTYATDGSPSDGAKALPGAEGTIAFKPDDHTPGKTTWWIDTDGIQPGIAGCHIGTDSNYKPNGRSFPEACTAEGLLVESNPGKDELHDHKNDIGHPDTFDCSVWCIGTGHKSGVCKAAPASGCKQQSAACSCW